MRINYHVEIENISPFIKYFYQIGMSGCLLLKVSLVLKIESNNAK